jgi:protein tyrosine phosphatase (PTP) superfamily phosphohydrolase (DUF442 family)
LLLLIGVKTSYVLFGRNFHTLLPGLIYRSAQPSENDLETLIRKHGIRTVINLRGSCPPLDWYQDECRVTHRWNVSQEDIYFSAYRLPSVHEARRLADVLEHSDYPILIHCRRGSDRTGLGAMVALLLAEGDLASARSQLSLRYGHVSLGRSAHLDRFLRLYEQWLVEQERKHTAASFRHWLREEYCPGECRAELKLLEPPTVLRPDEPAALKLRARNLSVRPWKLRAGSNAGIHAVYSLFDEEGGLLQTRRAGLFDARVPPGDAIDLTLALPALETGRYLLRVDMIDEQHCSFYQCGSELLEVELEVREQEMAAGRRPGPAGRAGLADRLATGR